MNGYLHVAKKDLRLSKRYGGEMECKKENALGSQICPKYKRGKNCAIFICPYRETAVATIPAIDFNPREKWEQIKQISIPQIITKVHNLAQLRLKQFL